MRLPERLIDVNEYRGATNAKSHRLPFSHTRQSTVEFLSIFALFVLIILAAAAVLLQAAAMLAAIRQNRRGSSPHRRQQDIFTTHWAHLLMLGGMIFVGMKMHRNIAVASLVIIPAALIAITSATRFLLRPRQLLSLPAKIFATA